MARTADSEARAFWRETLGENPTPEQIEAELHDFYLCIQEVPKVYDELTQGRFSKPHTMAQYIIDRVRELEDEHIAEAVAGATTNLARRIAHLEAREAALVAALTRVGQLAHGQHGGRGSFRWCGEPACREAYRAEQAAALVAAP